MNMINEDKYNMYTCKHDNLRWNIKINVHKKEYIKTGVYICTCRKLTLVVGFF